MNSSELRAALHRDAELAGEPPGDLLQQVWDRRRRVDRRRAGIAAVTLGVAVLGAGIPVGAALFGGSPGGEGVAASAGGPAPAAAEPTTPSVAEQRASLAAQFGIPNPPEVPVLQLVTPQQRGPLVQACMTGRGYPLGQDSYRVPVEETAGFRLAQYVCHASYPIDPSYVGVPADERGTVGP